jgi:large subunit ribosomal protein L4
VAAPKAPVIGSTKSVTLEEDVFGAEIKANLVHETVRAEQNEARAATRGGKSRGLVAGGRAKPWRQKGTGRARAGGTRAPHWTGGGMAFPPNNRNFDVKVNRKARKAALRSALSAHAHEGTLGVLDPAAFEAPSTKAALELLGGWGKELPLLVVVQPEEGAVIKSFRNLQRVMITVPAELEVTDVVRVRSLLISESALELVQGRAQ